MIKYQENQRINQIRRRAKDGTFRGGARPGAGRPRQRPGGVLDAELIEFAMEREGGDALAELFARIQAGNLAAAWRLARIFQSCRDELLKNREATAAEGTAPRIDLFSREPPETTDIEVGR